MRILYSLMPSLAPEQKEQAKAALLSALPGADVSFDNGGDLLSVGTPYGMAPDDVSRTVTGYFAGIGVTVAEVRREADRMNGAPYAPFAPARRERTVRFSTFIISLVAAVLAAVILTFGGTMGIIYLIGLAMPPETLGTTGENREDYAGKIGLIDEIFEKYSLYDTDGNLLLDEMLKAYAAASGDDYAAYYTKQELQEMQDRFNGKMVGIGVSYVYQSEPRGLMITDVMPNAPAAVAGLEPGDLIIGVQNGEEEPLRCAENGSAAVAEAIRGAAGTAVRITVNRTLHGGTEQTFTVTRAEIETVTAIGRVSTTDGTVGIIRITEFDTSTPAQFKAAVADLQDKGCTAFVFDLRNNPGGDLKPLMAMASYFLQENDKVYTERHKDGSTETYTVKAVTYDDGYYNGCSVTAAEIGQYRDLQFSVLVNENTASAAELFTAVVRDYDLAKTVGTTTFGKGILQSIFDLTEFGYSGGLKLTTGYYDPPSGVNYHKKGITPDEQADNGDTDPLLVTLLTEEQDAQLGRAIQTAKS